MSYAYDNSMVFLPLSEFSGAEFKALGLEQIILAFNAELTGIHADLEFTVTHLSFVRCCCDGRYLVGDNKSGFGALGEQTSSAKLNCRCRKLLVHHPLQSFTAGRVGQGATFSVS